MFSRADIRFWGTETLVHSVRRRNAMYEPAGCSTRAKALVGLAMYGATVVLTVLLFTDSGRGCSDVCFPPLLTPAVLLGLFTSTVTLGLGVASCVTSFKVHRW